MGWTKTFRTHMDLSIPILPMDGLSFPYQATMLRLSSRIFSGKKSSGPWPTRKQWNCSWKQAGSILCVSKLQAEHGHRNWSFEISSLSAIFSVLLCLCGESVFTAETQKCRGPATFHCRKRFYKIFIPFTQGLITP